MSLTDDQIIKVASLAKLQVTQDEMQSVSKKINDVLSLVNELQKVNTDDVAPMAHPYDVHQFLREDIVTSANQRELLQQNAPETTAGLYIVPQVIDSE